MCVAYAYSRCAISVDRLLPAYHKGLAWLTVVSPLMVYEGFLVSVTWTEQRMRLKLSEVLHSTASNVTDRFFSGSTQSPHGWSKNFSVYSFSPLGWKRVTFMQPKRQIAKLGKGSKSPEYKAFLPAQVTWPSFTSSHVFIRHVSISFWITCTILFVFILRLTSVAGDKPHFVPFWLFNGHK